MDKNTITYLENNLLMYDFANETKKNFLKKHKQITPGEYDNLNNIINDLINKEIIEKSPEERLIYEDNGDCDYEEAKERLIMDYKYENPDSEEVWEPSEIDIYNEISRRSETLQEKFADEMDIFIRDDVFLLQGTIQTWQGHFSGGFIFDNFYKFSRVFNNAICSKIYDVNGEFIVEITHHDGTNYFTVRKLNKQGYNYYQKHYIDDNDECERKKLHDTLSEDKYSSLPNFAHKMYGIKKETYQYTGLESYLNQEKGLI